MTANSYCRWENTALLLQFLGDRIDARTERKGIWEKSGKEISYKRMRITKEMFFFCPFYL
jgi:hypothetical protein